MARRKLTPGHFKYALLGSLALGLWSHTASADTLQDAMALAYQGNPNLLAARAQLRATDENVPIALSGWRPTLDVSGQFQNSSNETRVFSGGNVGQLVAGGTTVRTSQSVRFQVVQPIFRGFRTIAKTAQARNQVAAQRARLESTEAQVLLQVATAYLDVLQNQAIVELRMSNVQVLTRQLEATNDRFRVGEITRTDVAQSEANLAGANAALVQGEGDLQQARSIYQNIVGKAPENLERPDLPRLLPESLQAAIDVAIRGNPNFLAADYTALAADEAISLTRGELLPSVQLIGTLSKGWNTVADRSRTKNGTALAQVSVPIYQAGAEYARLRQSKHTAGQRRFLADQARLDARNSATTSWENLQATTAAIDSFQAQVSANKIALEGVQREAEVGARTVLDVLEEEQRLLNSRVNLVQAQRNQVVAAYQLLSSMGTLTGADIGLGAPVHEPEFHFEDALYQFFGGDADAGSDANR
jgi:outer membrane protein